MTFAERTVGSPDARDLARAATRIRSLLAPTPLVDTDAASGAALKLECWQPTGSFKVRGALWSLTELNAAQRTAGVVTASAGNHALGIAYAAERLGVEATVVVPTTASPAKVRALRGRRVRLVEHGTDFEAAERHALDLAAEGRTYISAYNDTAVIAGQASIASELRAQAAGPLTVVAPVGGGGLVAGLCLVAAQDPEMRIVGVESASSNALSAAVAAGRVVPVEVGATVADGLAGNLEPGSVTPSIVAEHVYALTAVTEPEIESAMRFLAAHHGLMVEGAGAVALAAVLAGKIDGVGRVVALVTGRNVALPVAARVLRGAGGAA
ncbi:pyridoxal-phosphate dependent enzyme [Asanoa sp. NPDC049573]|uniref:threonine ammonia-lyase n=1 Tax=Asanoa sp. NPDC049573 TaxID=3155396 RepID=UPI003429D4A9